MTQLKSSKLSSVWFRHIKEPKAQASFQELIYNNNTNLVLKRLYNIHLEELKALEAHETKQETYDNPAWAYHQAFINGQKQKLKASLDLLAFTQNKDLK